MSKKEKVVNNMTVQMDFDPEVLKMLLNKISGLECRIQMLEASNAGVLANLDHIGRVIRK